MELNELIKKELILNNCFSEEELNNFIIEANKENLLLSEYLIKNNKIDIDFIFNLYSKIFNIEYLKSINIYSLNKELLNKFNKSFILIKRVIPYREIDEELIVLIDNPLKMNEVSSLYYFSINNFKFKLVNPKTMDTLIEYISSKEDSEEALVEFNKTSEKKENKKENILTSEDFLTGPSIQLADSLLKEAISENASDIHIEPRTNEVIIRFRIDGSLKFHSKISKEVYSSLLARYKIIAQMDISERRRPQDGKVTMDYNGIKYDFRISSLPIIYGEKLVIRLFSSLLNNESIEYLIHDKEDLNLVNDLLSAPYGIILLTGPTGSGKTTTLYSFLRRLNKPERNITTIEDPVENNILGINQVQVNTKTGLSFSLALRSILRQDPNIIMIGEIRDSETAKIAVQSAITGHLVFSSVHTNNALSTVTRLIDMGVEPYLVADSMVGAISQRLVKRLCPYCKKEHIVTKEEELFLDIKKGTKVYEALGCQECNNTGYLGRIGVFEILKMNDKLKNAISTHYDDLDLLKTIAFNEGLVPLAKKTSRLVLEGITSIDEFKSINNVSELIHEKNLIKNN